MSIKIYPGSSFQKWLKRKGYSKSAVAEQLGVSRQQVYSYFNAENLQRSTVEKILDTYKVTEDSIWGHVNNVNAKPVKSDMVNEPRIEYGKGVNDFIPLKNGSHLMITPLVEEYAQAGFLSGYADLDFLEELPNHSIVVDRFHKGQYYSFRVTGESMDNGSSESIVNGSIVTGREIKKELWTSRFHINKFKDYVIVHAEGILVKRIIDHDTENGTITCRSINKDKEAYPDFIINLDECKMILNIVNVSTGR